MNADSADYVKRCEHWLPEGTECEQCLWEQMVLDDQALDEDWPDFYPCVGP